MKTISIFNHVLVSWSNFSFLKCQNIKILNISHGPRIGEQVTSPGCDWLTPLMPRSPLVTG